MAGPAVVVAMLVLGTVLVKITKKMVASVEQQQKLCNEKEAAFPCRTGATLRQSLTLCVLLAGKTLPFLSLVPRRFAARSGAHFV